MQKKYLRISLICIVILASDNPVQSQEKTSENVEQTWLGYFNNLRLSDKWGVATDLHYRTRDDIASGSSIGILRAGLVYHINSQTRLIAGYAYVHNYPIAPHNFVARPEHRPWQMVQWNTRNPNMQLVQNLRFEQRFRRKISNEYSLAEGYNFNYRFRYNFMMQVPLGKKKFEPGALSLMMNDEIHVNMGKEIIYNYFDQNRFFAGFNWQMNKTNHLQFGYTYVFLQLPAGNRYRNIHGIRIFFVQNFDLRKPASSK